jgi:hypothetical protein
VKTKDLILAAIHVSDLPRPELAWEQRTEKPRPAETRRGPLGESTMKIGALRG